MQDQSDPLLDQLISNALLRFDANLRAALPETAPQLLRFLRDIPTRPEHAFGARAFPHFVLPYWLSPARERIADAEFQTDVIYSTISGYYSIRLCDNIGDNDGPPELRKFAPCAAYFDSEFIRPYMTYFSAKDEFWHLFDRFWAQQAEASAADGLLNDVDEKTFASLSSKKFTATKIPLAAVRSRYLVSKSEFDDWLQFVDYLGRFAQFSNDFFDWRHDSLQGITTYVSSEWKRRAPDDSIASWFLREGFDWGVDELKSRFETVKREAEVSGNKAVLDWVAARGRTLNDDIEEMRSGLELVKTFGRIISGQRP
jgi:hypothetical protein